MPSESIIITSIPSPVNESRIVAERIALVARSTASCSVISFLNCGSKTPRAISAPVPTAAYSSGRTEPSGSRVYIVGSSTTPPTIICVRNGKNLLSYMVPEIIFAIEFVGTSRLSSILRILASAAICSVKSCMSATSPAHATATFGVI